MPSRRGADFGVTADGFQDRSRETGTTRLSSGASGHSPRPYWPAAGLFVLRTPSQERNRSSEKRRSAVDFDITAYIDEDIIVRALSGSNKIWNFDHRCTQIHTDKTEKTSQCEV